MADQKPTLEYGTKTGRRSLRRAIAITIISFIVLALLLAGIVLLSSSTGTTTVVTTPTGVVITGQYHSRAWPFWARTLIWSVVAAIIVVIVIASNRKSGGGRH